MPDWRPVRRLKQFPKLNPDPFDPTENSFIPDLGVDNEKIRTVSPRKVQLIGAKVYRSSDQTISDVTFTAVSWGVESYDTSDFWTSGTDITIPYNGIYDISAYAEFESGAGADRRCKLVKNGTGVGTYSSNTVGGGSPSQVMFNTVLKLVEADVLTFEVRQNSGGNLKVNGGESNNFFAITYLGTI